MNRSLVLQSLQRHGPLSRSELARLTNVSNATIGTIVATLLDDGLLHEVPEQIAAATAGRPPRALSFSRSAGLSIGLAVRELAVEGVLVNARRDVLAQASHEIPSPDDRNAMHRAVAATALDLARASEHPAVGIGMAIPGVVDATTATVTRAAAWPSLEGSWLRSAFTELGFDRRYLANDALAEALAEQRFGTVAGDGPFVALHVSEGIGAGYSLDGSVAIRIGELGHTTVDREGLHCRCGAYGCWETVASLTWLRSEAVSRDIAGGSTLDVVEVEAQARTDAMVRELRSEWISNLAIGIANAVQSLGPMTFVLQGDLARASDEFVAELEADTRSRCLLHHRGELTIVASELGTQATAVGAACLVLNDFFRSGGRTLASDDHERAPAKT
jgi:predicted NBD/HSP70 family sugar kinase